MFSVYGWAVIFASWNGEVYVLRIMIFAELIKRWCTLKEETNHSYNGCASYVFILWECIKIEAKTNIKYNILNYWINYMCKCKQLYTEWTLVNNYHLKSFVFSLFLLFYLQKIINNCKSQLLLIWSSKCLPMICSPFVMYLNWN